MGAACSSDGFTPAEPSEAPPPEIIEDDSAPIGPSEAEEASYLAEQRNAGESGSTPSAGAPAADEPEETAASLPALDALIQRIPAEARAVMDELFRAKFTKVTRVPKKALKTGA